MRAVVQRVSQASVTVEEHIVANIGSGLLVLIGIAHDDSRTDSEYMIHKILKLRIFPDHEGVMNRSVEENNLEILLVSQFTLYGDCRKGNRPSYQNAMAPEKAKIFYEEMVNQFHDYYPKIYRGIFGASMQISLVNDGPVTILIDTKKNF